MLDDDGTDPTTDELLKIALESPAGSTSAHVRALVHKTFSSCERSFLLFASLLRVLWFAKTDAARPREALWSADEVARYLGVSKKSIYRAVKKGELAAVSIGRRKLFEPEEVDRYRTMLVRGTPHGP